MAEVAAAEVPQAEKDELFCAYAAMILHDSGLDISEESLNTLIKAAGGSIESFFPALFAKMCQGKDLESMLKFGGGGGGAAFKLKLSQALSAIMQKIAKEAKVLQDQMTLESPLLPLGIIASPVVATVLFIAGVLANVFILPFVIMYQIFAFFFPDTASRVLNIALVYYEGVLIFALRVRETARTFIMTNLQKETYYNGKKLEPFFPAFIAMSPNAHEYMNPKQLGEEFVRQFGQYMPDNMLKNLAPKQQ